jgi:hypothetical protein
LTFDHVVFNFPHLGKEDAAAHAAMIAHVMNAWKLLVASSSSVSKLYLTVTTQQADLWQLHGMAKRNGLLVVDETPFNRILWPGYQLRRHHVGKSFQTRVQSCMHYTIVGTDDDATSTAGINLFHIPSAISTTKNNNSSSNSSTSNSITESVTSNHETTIDGRKKRKLSKASDQFTFTRIGVDNTNAATSTTETNQWRCNTCLRCFASEQGIRTHIHQVHVLEVTGPASTDLCCHQCGKAFSNSDALFQHTKAKHDKAEHDKAEHAQVIGTARASEDDDTTKVNRVNGSASEGDIECLVCGMMFDNEYSVKDHMQQFKPIDVADLQLQCYRCNKLCTNERGLQQHLAFCQQGMNE